MRAAEQEAPKLTTDFSGAERGKAPSYHTALDITPQSSQLPLQPPKAPASNRNTVTATMIGIALLGAGIFARERKTPPVSPTLRAPPLPHPRPS